MENKDIEEILDLVEQLNSEINESIGKFKAVADLDFEPSILPGGRFVLANKNFPNNSEPKTSRTEDITPNIG